MADPASIAKENDERLTSERGQLRATNIKDIIELPPGTRKKRSASTEAPLVVLLRAVSQFQKGLINEVELTKTIKDLGSGELLEPDYDNLYQDISNDTKEWLINEYSGATMRRRASLQGVSRIRPVPTHHESLTKSQIAVLLKSWEFDVFKYAENQLFTFIEEMFLDFELPSRFNFSIETLRKFIFEIYRRYQPNPYHNFAHAFDVLQTVYYFLVRTNATDFLEDMDIFALLIAALCHDVDHPGTNNNFQVASQSALAITYNDVSVLENHHAATTFKLLLSTPDANVLSGLSPPQLKRIRTLIIELILGTDMAKHFGEVSLLKSRTESGLFSADSPDDVLLLQKLLLHAADISNPAKPFDLAKRWSDLVISEFVAQGELERSRGFEVSPGMDKSKINQPSMAANFIEYIAAPLYEALCSVLPALDKQCAILRENQRRWREMLTPEHT